MVFGKCMENKVGPRGCGVVCMRWITTRRQTEPWIGIGLHAGPVAGWYEKAPPLPGEGVTELSDQAAMGTGTGGAKKRSGTFTKG